jgi:uncharacterized protein YdhG (YjbR/CyaY superfamily)
MFPPQDCAKADPSGVGRDGRLRRSVNPVLQTRGCRTGKPKAQAMPKPQPKSVDEYIAAQTEATRPILERLRRTIRKALPDAEETIAYNIPTYKLNGVSAVHFAAWKEYCSLYPANDRIRAEFGNELAPYDVVKSTIHFPFTKPLPVRLIARIATFRAQELGKRR